MANSVVQTIRNAEVDARSLSEFIYSPANAMVSRRLAPSIHSLQYYLDFLDTIPSTVQDAIDNTAIEGGVLADTFVTVTAKRGGVARSLYSKNTDIISVKDFGAKGDGVTDDTLAIQSAINATDSSSSLFFPSGEYLVSKNTALSGYPDNDQPCLILKDKTGVSLFGESATLVCKTHGQGILEVINCSETKTKGLMFRGLGIFPPLDGSTGYGELGLGDGSAGYRTAGYWGIARNNSVPTDTNTDGGYSGSFTQDDGSKAGTWGKWHGGYIGNAGSGVTVVGGRNNTFIDCMATGFNYAGFAVGKRGSESVKTINTKFYNCISDGNYYAGIVGATNIDTLTVESCTITNNGHPDSSSSDGVVGTGYGTNSQHDTVKGFNVYNSKFVGNKRKGIDYHAGVDFEVRGNRVSESMTAGIFAVYTMDTLDEKGFRKVDRFLIKDNFIEMPSNASPNYLGGIVVETLRDLGSDVASPATNSIISSNIVKAPFKAFYSRSLSYTRLISNTFIADGTDATGQYLVVIGRTGDLTTDLTFSDNNVSGSIYFGIVSNTVISANIFDGLNYTAASRSYLGDTVSIVNNVFKQNKSINGGIDHSNIVNGSAILRDTKRVRSAMESETFKITLGADSATNNTAEKVAGLGGSRFNLVSLRSADNLIVLGLKQGTSSRDNMWTTATYVGSGKYAVVIQENTQYNVRMKLIDLATNAEVNPTTASGYIQVVVQS